MITIVFALSFAVQANALGENALQKNRVSPIEKVIEMISDLQKKVIAEGTAEQKTYDEFAEWCEEQSKELGYTIKTAKTEIEDLQATIEKASSDISDEEEKIGTLTSTISTDEADLKAATAIRKKEQGVFQAQEKELMEAVDILSRAVGILERELGAGASLAQMKTKPGVLQALRTIIDAEKINNGDTKKLEALLQTQHKDAESDEDKEDDMMLGAPDPAAFKSNAGGIVATINDMLEESKAELEEARKKEIKNT